MKLHTEKGKFTVSDAHDLAVAARLFGPCGNLELLGQRVGLNHEAVIPRRLKRIIKTGKQSSAIVMNQVRFTVHEILGANDRSSKCLPHRLMSKTYAQKR